MLVNNSNKTFLYSNYALSFKLKYKCVMYQRIDSDNNNSKAVD
jgi:hypothetical protein